MNIRNLTLSKPPFTTDDSDFEKSPYPQFLNNLPLAVYSCDKEGYITFYNKAAVGLWGREPDKENDLWCGSKKIYKTDGTPLPLHLCPMAIAVKEDRIILDHEFIIETPEGLKRHVEVSPQPIYDDTGKIAGAINVLLDVTARKQSEQALRVSEERLRHATEGADIGTFNWDLIHDKYNFSSRLAQIFGYADVAGITHQSLLDAIYPEDKPIREQALLKALKSGMLWFEVRVMLPDQSLRWIRVNGRTVFTKKHEPVNIHGIVMDITDQKNAVIKMQESEERLRLAILSADLGTWDWNPLTREVIWDDRCKELFGLPPDAVLNEKVFLTALHPEDRRRVKEIIQYTLHPESGGFFDIECRSIGKDNKQVRWLRAKGKAYYKGGKTYRFTGTVLDITEQKMAERRIRESEERLRLATETAELGTWDLDLATGLSITTEHHREIFGYTEGTVWGKEKYFECIHRDDLVMVDEEFKKALTNGKLFYEARIIRPDKTLRWIRVNGQTLYDDHHRPTRMIGTAMDITPQKFAKEELEKTVADRTKALRKANAQLERSNHELEQFAYIASHDLQEPLRKIQTFASLAEKNIHDELFIRKHFEKINESARRMSALIRDVLNYSKLSKSDEPLQQTDLNVIIKDIVSDFELMIREKNASIQVEKLPMMKGIPHQLNQLFSNLIGNSLKFCAIEPVIEITGRKITSDSSAKYPELKPNRDYVLFTLKDNGIGFEQKYAEQIFTIFSRLNHRNAYKGTGIGLAICKRIVENHRGFIRAKSEPGKGATFEIALPCSLSLSKAER